MTGVYSETWPFYSGGCGTNLKDWNWVPRIKSWVKMSHCHKICQNKSEKPTNLLICSVENKHSKWTVLLLQMSMEAQSCNCEIERTVPLPVPLLRNSNAKKTPHRSHRMRLDWELERNWHTHSSKLLPSQEKCNRPQKNIFFSKSFGRLFPDDWHPG